MKRGAIIATITTFQLLAQILIQLIVVKTVGVGAETDAYIAAQAVPVVVGAVVISALQSVWLPRLSVLSERSIEMRRQIGLGQAQALILSCGLALSFGLTMSLWLPEFFPGFAASQSAAATKYSVLFLATFVFTTQSSLLVIALRAQDRFLIGEIVSLAGTISSLILIWIFLPIWGLQAAAWLALLRALTVYLFQLHLASWPRFQTALALKDRDSWRAMRPLLFGASIYKASPIVDRYWGSLAPSGAITLLSLAQTVIVSIATVLERSSVVPLAPTMSRLIASGDYRQATYLYRRFTIFVAVVTFAVIGVLFGGAQILQLVLSHVLSLESDTASKLLMLIVALGGYLFASVAGAAQAHVLYSMGDTKTPVYVGVSGFAIGFVFKWLLFSYYGVLGIAIATSCYFLLNIAMFMLCIEIKMRRLEAKK